MYKNKRILAVIPARGGSKGLPGKNIKMLTGKPLVAWSIEQALASSYIDMVVVSTESPKIASIARRYGAQVPFLRPRELATDKAKSIDVVLHAIDFFESKGNIFDIVVMLEPTSPLRETKDVDRAIEVLISNRTAESIVGIAKVEAVHPAFLVKLEKGFLRSYLKAFKVLRRQELDDLYFYEGSLYISYSSSLKHRKRFYHNKTLGYIMPKWKSFELDDYTDFIIIESLMKAKKYETMF